jgi:hypothetical protein
MERWQQTWEENENCMTEIKNKSKKLKRALMQTVGKRDHTTNTNFSKVDQESVTAVAATLAREKGTNKELEERKLWHAIYDQSNSQTSAGAVTIQKKFAATEAEARLHSLASKIAKRDGISYAQATTKALAQNPSLYSDYVEEVNKGLTYNNVLVPEEYLASGPTFKSAAATTKAKSHGDQMQQAYQDDDQDQDGDDQDDDDQDQDGDDQEGQEADYGKRRAKAKSKLKASDQEGCERIREKAATLAKRIGKRLVTAKPNNNTEAEECPHCQTEVIKGQGCFCSFCGHKL